MKKIALVIGTLLIAAALVTVGWLFGTRQHVLNEMFSVTLIDKQITEAVSTATLLNSFDSGRPDDARYSLRLKLDGNILFIDSLLPDSDQRTRDLAGLVRVALRSKMGSGNQSFPVTSRITRMIRRSPPGP